jgi:uncharacterized SAM-binding protein YcdF (DUF218 family)
MGAVASATPARRTTTPRRLAAGLGVLLAVVVAIPLWLPTLGTALVVRDELRPADAIVATYSVMNYWGLPEVSRLYAAGLAPVVVLSDFEYDVLAEARVQPSMRRELARQGVPEAAVVAIGGETPTSELDEAVALRALFDARGWRSAIVVTREYRALRTRGALGGVFRGRPVELRMHSVPVPGVDLARWWTSRFGVNSVMNEWARVFYYGARGRY